MEQYRKSESCSTFSSVGLDHRIVSLRMRLSLRYSKMDKVKDWYNWQKLEPNRKQQDKNAVEIRDKFQELDMEGETPREKYQRFIVANQKVVEMHTSSHTQHQA